MIQKLYKYETYLRNKSYLINVKINIDGEYNNLFLQLTTKRFLRGL